MFRGLYTAWTGMANEQKRLDVISNNMANSNTVGYKDEKVASQAFDQVLGSFLTVCSLVFFSNYTCFRRNAQAFAMGKKTPIR